MSKQFEIVFLGTGSPLPSTDRCGSGHVLVAGGNHVLVDCGWGAARRLMPSGIFPALINTVIFTHMHSDHITDFPDFLFLRWTGGAQQPLRVFGPQGTQETVQGFLMAIRQDIGFRQTHHGDKLHPAGIEVQVTELPASEAPRAFLDIDGLLIESFEVDHRPVVPAFGYRARYDGRVVVLSGDTSFCQSLLAASQGADMLVSEAVNTKLLGKRIDGLRALGLTLQATLFEDIPDYHLPTLELAKLAQDAGVGELLVTHLIPPVSNDAAEVEPFIEGMSKIYRGRIRVARDTERVTVSKTASTPGARPQLS